MHVWRRGKTRRAVFYLSSMLRFHNSIMKKYFVVNELNFVSYVKMQFLYKTINR